MTISINIKKEFSGDYITRVAGERLRNIILDAVARGEVVELDFTGAVVASTSFFDEGFAKLADFEWDKEKFRSSISIVGMNSRDEKLMREICAGRGIEL